MERLKPGSGAHGLAPGFLVLPVTYRCNLRCRSCFCPEQAGDAGELSPASIGNCIDSLNGDNRPGVVNVNLTGGELFLRADVAEIAHVLYGRGVNAIGVSSNGLLADKTVSGFRMLMESCPDIDWSMQLSIDGPEDVHNSIRGNKSAFGSVISSLDGLLELKKSRRFWLGVNFTISRENVSYLREHDAWLASRYGGDVDRQYTFAVDSDLYINSKVSAIGAEASDTDYVARVRDAALWLYRAKKDFFALDVYLMSLGYDRFTPCAFQTSGYFMDPRADVYKCSVAADSFIYNAAAGNPLVESGASDAVAKIAHVCKSCLNNCGNYLVSDPVLDFLRSGFIKSRRRVFLDRANGCMPTRVALGRAGVVFEEYKGQDLKEADAALYVDGSAHESRLASMADDHRVHLIPRAPGW